MMIGFLIQSLIEFFRATLLGDTSVLIQHLFITLFVILSITQIPKFNNKFQEAIITLFLGLIQAGYNLVYFNGDPQTYQNIYNTYYFGHCNALFEAAIANRIPSFNYRTGFRIVLLLLRFLTIPIVDKAIIPTHLLCCFVSIYLDYDKEKHDRDLFVSYFNSRQQLNKFKDLLVNDIPEGIVVLSQDLAKCLFANRFFLQLIGPELSQNPLQSFNSFILDDTPRKHVSSFSIQAKQQTLSTYLQVLKENKAIFQKNSCTLTFNKQSDEYVLDVKIIPLFWNEQRSIGLVLHDLTQQKAMTRLKIASNLNTQKDRILATVSHELRTPLNGILGMIQIIQQKVQDSELLQYLTICNNSGNLLLGLVNSILDLNLISANKIKLHPEKVNFQKALQEIIQLFEYQCKLKSIFIKLKMSPIIPKFITTDKNRLNQILINLIGNSLKFTSKGGITISAAICPQSEDYIEISVEDTGMGIREEDKGKLFQIFEKIETGTPETAVNTQGVGLGLTLSNNLAKLLCNNLKLQGINLETEYGKGTKFSFFMRKDLGNTSNTSDGEVSADLINEGVLNQPINFNSRYPLSPLKKPHSSQKPSDPNTSPVSIPNLSNKGFNFTRQSIKAFTEKPSSSKQFNKSPSILQDEFVLIIDDNPLNIAVAEFFVLKHGFKVKTALSGQAAISTMLKNDHSAHPVKLILMDLQMPVMTGYQVTQALFNLMEEGKIPITPIVALTANDSEDDRKICKDLGMSGYLTKPIKESELSLLLQRPPPSK